MDSKNKIIIDDVIFKKPELIEPCFVQFTNGNSIKPEESSANLFRTIPDKKYPDCIKSCIEVSNLKNKFFGQNIFENHKYYPNKERFFLGILNKETGKMKLVESSVFLVHSQVQEDARIANEKKKMKAAPKSLSTTDAALLRETTAQRVAEFGGKKARSRLRKTKELAVDLDTMSNAFEAAAAEVEEIDFKEMEEIMNFDHLLPLCDKEAKLIANIYDLSSIISDEELMEFYDYAKDILEKNLDTKDKILYSMLFSQTLATCKLSFEGDKLLKYTCANLYMDSLIFLSKLKKDNLTPSSFKALCCPPILLNKMLTQFTIGEKRRRKTEELQDKLSCHILVLALILNEYELSLPVLLQSMGIEKAKLEKLLRIVGATLKGQTEVKLQFPLTYITVIQRKRKVRR